MIEPASSPDRLAKGAAMTPESIPGKLVPDAPELLFPVPLADEVELTRLEPALPLREAA
jgi:hypothetical protein